MNLDLNSQTVAVIIILIISIIIHEISHGYAALAQGDHTAENAGRLTLNPISHIDLLGSIILPAFFILSGSNFFFGYAKPVPYNPYNLKNKKWGEAIVAMAGPLSNIVLAIVFAISLNMMIFFEIENNFASLILINAVFLNIFLAILNLIPIPPLDGSKILYSFLPLSHYNTIRNFLEKYQLMFFFILLIIIISTDTLQKVTSVLTNLLL